MRISRAVLRHFRRVSEEKRRQIQLSSVLGLRDVMPGELRVSEDWDFVHLLIELSRYVGG